MKQGCLRIIDHRCRHLRSNASIAQSDAEKIASAQQAGPQFVTQNAIVLDYPTLPSGEYRVLRAGTNGWTCLPGFPGAAHDEPGCFEQVFLQFIKDTTAGRTPSVQSVGISICIGANGCRTSRTRWEAAMSSTLGRTS
jgi:hypothetical protein